VECLLAWQKSAMYSKTAWRSSALVGQDCRRISSFLSVAEKLSATALSKQSPRLPVDLAMPALPQAWPEGQRHELAALVRVVDQPGFRSAPRYRHARGAEDEV
jgi:predicted component of type VI protein secretion system